MGKARIAESLDSNAEANDQIVPQRGTPSPTELREAVSAPASAGAGSEVEGMSGKGIRIAVKAPVAEGGGVADVQTRKPEVGMSTAVGEGDSRAAARRVEHADDSELLDDIGFVERELENPGKLEVKELFCFLIRACGKFIENMCSLKYVLDIC